jgi:hypothetical protein
MADSLYTISVIASDPLFAQRLYAGAAQEGAGEPMSWVSAHRWEIAAAPTWAEKVDYWLASNPSPPDSPPNNGWALDVAVISDGDITARIQQLLTAPPG